MIQTLPVCKVGLRHSFLQPSDFSEAIMIQDHEPKAAMLHGVSVLELCLVIAMKHISEISDGEPFNFEMVYNGKMTVRIWTWVFWMPTNFVKRPRGAIHVIV